MQINNLKRTHQNKKAQQVGRGGTRGKTSGRGTKGQNARAGHKKRPEMRDFIKRLPKLRGRGVNINQSIQLDYVPVSLAIIEKSFNAGEKVNPGTLVAKNILSLMKGKNPKVKILATGEVTKKLLVSGCAISTSAKLKIEKAGGSVVA